jgi:hypothetical protein
LNKIVLRILDLFVFYVYGQKLGEPGFWGGEGVRKKEMRKWNNCRTKCKQNLPFTSYTVKGAQKCKQVK